MFPLGWGLLVAPCVKPVVCGIGIEEAKEVEGEGLLSKRRIPWAITELGRREDRRGRGGGGGVEGCFLPARTTTGVVEREDVERGRCGCGCRWCGVCESGCKCECECEEYE